MRKWIVVAAVVVIVIIAAAAVTARLLYPPEKVRALIIEQASEAIGAPVTVEDAKLSLYPLGVSVSGVVVGNPVEGEPPLLELPEGTVSVKILPLLSRRIEVARVFLRDPVIHFVKEPLPPPPVEPDVRTAPVPEETATGVVEEGGASFALLLSSAEVENATVTYVDRATGDAYDLGGLDAKTSLGLERDGKIAAEGGLWIGSLSGPSIEALGFGEGFRDLAIDYDLHYDPSAGTAEVRSLRFTLARLAVDLQGEASGLPDSLRASLTLATERVELADLLSLLPAETAAAAADFEGSGPLSLEGEIHIIPEGPPAYRVAVGLGGLDVRNKKLSESITGLKGRIEATESAVRFEEVAGSIGGRPFGMNGSVENFADPAVDLMVKADLDLAALGRAGLLPEGTALSGGLNADVRARGRVADPNGVALDGSIKITSARYALAEPPVEAANASGDIVLSGRSAETKNLRFDLNGSPTTLTGKVTDPLGDLRATANLSTRKIDFNAFLPPAAEGAGGKPVPGTAADPPPIVLPPLPPITLGATIKADTVITGVNVLTGAEATLDVKNGEGTIKIRMARGLFGGVAVKEATGDLRVKDMTLSGDLTAAEALAFRVPLTSIRGKIAMTPDGVVTLDGITGKVWQGSVAGDASVRLNEPGGATYRFTARAENVEANDFLTNLTPAKNILYGKFRLESAWEGRGLTEEELLASLSAEGTMKAAEGKIRNLTALKRAADLLGMKDMEQIEFREFWSKFAVEKGRVHIDDLLVKGKNADWNAAGSVGFDGTLDYALTITLSEANSAAYRKKSALTSLFTDPSGRVVLDVKVGGTTDKPAVTLDASKTASRAGIQGLDKVIDDIQKDENVQKVIGDLLGGKAPSLDGLFGGSKKKTPPDTSKASGQK